MSSRKSLLVGANFSLILVLTAAFGQQAHADVLLDAPSGGASYYGMYCDTCIAASFTLTASYDVSTIDIVLRTPTTTSSPTFDFSLQNSLTNPSTTFASTALTAPQGGIGTKVSMNVNKTLLAGTYYLVGNVRGYSAATVTAGDVNGWLLSTGVYNNAAGTITAGVWGTSGFTWSLIQRAAPAFTLNGSPTQFLTKNSASFAAGPPVAPGMIAFGEAAGVAPALLVASTNPWPDTLGGVHLEITDFQGVKRSAPVYFADTGSIGFLIPVGTALGPATTVLTTSTGATISGSLYIGRISPGLYTANASGSGVAAGYWIRIASDGSRTQDYLFDPVSAVGNRVPVPVDLGAVNDQVFLSLYGTGFSGSSGASATVGGVPVPVYGFAPVGVYQGEDVVNIGPLPRSLAGRGEVLVVLSFDNQPANVVTVNFR